MSTTHNSAAALRALVEKAGGSMLETAYGTVTKFQFLDQLQAFAAALQSPAVQPVAVQIDDLDAFSPAPFGQGHGMVRGGDYVRLSDVRVLLASPPPAAPTEQAAPQAEAKEDRAPKSDDMLSMAIGIIQGMRRNAPYTDNSPIAKFVAEAAEWLKDWPFTAPTGAQAEPVADDTLTAFAAAMRSSFGAEFPSHPNDKGEYPGWEDHWAIFQAGVALASPAAPSLASRIAELIEQHGSLRAAARVLDCDPGYLSRLQSGEKSDPGETLLRRMGLRQITTYERSKP